MHFAHFERFFKSHEANDLKLVAAAVHLESPAGMLLV
jgi:hypothetical protein